MPYFSFFHKRVWRTSGKKFKKIKNFEWENCQIFADFIWNDSDFIWNDSKVKLTVLLLYVYVHFGWIGSPQNDLYCVGWEVKPYTLTHSLLVIVQHLLSDASCYAHLNYPCYWFTLPLIGIGREWDTGRLHFLTQTFAETFAEPKLRSKYLLKSKSVVISKVWSK